jgi:hypothetical protein
VPDYSGEDQFSILFSILQDYDIVQKLKAIIADNAAPNNVFYRTIETHYKNKKEKK